jgi:hypothetical protein
MQIQVIDEMGNSLPSVVIFKNDVVVGITDGQGKSNEIEAGEYTLHSIGFNDQKVNVTGNNTFTLTESTTEKDSVEITGKRTYKGVTLLYILIVLLLLSK